MAKARPKRKTSIRTIAGVAQEKFLQRVRELADDPLRVLPECPGGEPKAIAKLHARLDKVAAGKAGFLDRRDKGIVGAVVQSMAIAEQESAPRLLDTKVAGKRRFFLQRGHVARAAMLAVQNHDEPQALIMAYRDMAKAEGIHFFAGGGFWCTGTMPRPPRAWLESLAAKAEAPLHEDGPDAWRIGGDRGGRVRLTFQNGPTIDIDPTATSGTHVHQALMARYAGPQQRQPVGVLVLMPDGNEEEPDRESVASYRAGVIDEKQLVDKCIHAWRQRQDVAGTARFVLGDRDFRDQDGFIAALAPEPWEEPALRAMTKDGFIGQGSSASDIFRARKDRVAEGIRAVLSDESAAARLLKEHANMQIRELIRKAHQEEAALQRDTTLPHISGGAEIDFIDAVARGFLHHGKAGALQAVRKALDAGKVPPGHVSAFLEAVGGDQGLAQRIDKDAAATGKHLAAAAAEVLAATGDAYPTATAAFLAAAGSSERLA